MLSLLGMMGGSSTPSIVQVLWRCAGKDASACPCDPSFCGPLSSTCATVQPHALVIAGLRPHRGRAVQVRHVILCTMLLVLNARSARTPWELISPPLAVLSLAGCSALTGRWCAPWLTTST